MAGGAVRNSPATAGYRLVARGVGRALGAIDGVRTVYLRRSVAAGEASFPRSDLDLTIVVEDASPQVVGAVARRLARLRRALPIVGEAVLHDAPDLERWSRIDTYRGALDRQVALPVHGPAPTLPRIPVDPRHALWRLAFWLEEYVPRAVRRRDVANLEKFTLEAIAAHAVATGLLPEPPRRRSDAATLPLAALLPHRDDRVEEWLAAFLRVVEAAQAALRPPLGELSSGVLELTLPGRGRTRLVLVATPDAPLPPQAFARDAIIATPLALDLLVHAVRPPLWWALPDDLAHCLPRPDSEDLRHFVASQSCLWRLAGPGFHPTSLDAAARRLALARALIESLRERSVPDRTWAPPAPMANLVAHSRADHYSRIYPRLRAEADSIRGALGDRPA